MSQQPKPTIEWICPDGDSEEILGSLVKRYEQEAASANVPTDPRQCIFSGYGPTYGSFQKGFHYHLGIAENRPWHGKDVYIKGFTPEDPKKPLFSIILFFLSKTQPIEIFENS